MEVVQNARRINLPVLEHAGGHVLANSRASRATASGSQTARMLLRLGRGLSYARKQSQASFLGKLNIVKGE